MNPEVPYIVLCPHCGDSILIEQINCRIFRHAVYKTTGEQMDPHTSTPFYISNADPDGRHLLM